MSSIRTPHTVMCDRAPLRDVQNERSALQQTSSVKVCEVYSDQKENLSESFISSDPHPCRSDANITFKSFTCAGGEVEILDESDVSHTSAVLLTHDSPRSLNNTTVTYEDIECEHQDHPYFRYTTDRTQEDHEGHVTSGTPSLSLLNAADVTFKSFTCPGGEVEIAADESVVCNDSTVATEAGFEAEVSDEHTELPSRHFDHPYCNNSQSSELRSGKPEQDDGSVNHASINISRSATDITFKSFTCPGGEVEIAEESIVQSESLSQNDSLVTNDLELQDHQSEICDEQDELPSRHFDHPYCNSEASKIRSGDMKEEVEDEEEEDEKDDDDGGGGGSVNHASISRNVTDLTFKSFTCPGGEVEIAEESLAQCESHVKNESVVQNESPVSDSEVQDLQSEACDEHTELPSRHLDHPYCNEQTKPFPAQVDATMLDAKNPEGVITPSESSEALNGSTAVERQDEVKSCFSDVEAEMPMLMKGLNIYNQTKSSPNSEHDGESVTISDNGNHIHEPEATESENAAHPRVHVSTSGVLESAEEVAEDTKTKMQVPEGSSDTTQVQDVQQQDLDQQPSCDPEQAAVENENTPPRRDAEVETEENGETSRPGSHPGVDRVSENVGPAEIQNVDKHSIVIPNANTSIHDDLEILRSESLDVESQMKMWSHIILSEPSTPKHSALGHLWLPDSPIPPPQLHSTVLTAPITPKPAPAPAPALAPAPAPASDHKELHKDMVMKEFSTVGQGPLQEQLRKMGELLIAASGKMSAPPAATPVQQHSACVWTTPTSQQERSTNTSAIMEERKDIDVSDACTSTDSLLWSVSRSNLESLPRSELEQKMISTLIMVEVLSQQLASAQSHNLRGRTEPSPSSLRDRLVQTERTELSQTGPYRELYVSALEKIQTLEIDQETFNSLHQAMQLMTNTMVRVKSEMQEALSSMKEMEGVITDDQEIHSQQLGQMKALLAHCMETLRKMEQKNRACVKDRDHMKQQMEEALEEKSTVLRVLEHLRVHHTTQVSDLQRNLGSHEELTTELTHIYPQLVELNRIHMDSVTEANTLLRQTMEDHTHLSAELQKAQQLLQRTFPVLHKLQQRTSAALQQSHNHQEERDRALEDREQMEQQLHDAHCGLQEAHQQISDLNTQITIMSSEMAVLREQLTEVEGERSELQRQTTELSATVSSSLASYAFLEQTLASETSKLQRSRHDAQEATERADRLQETLSVCERRVEELEQMMAQRESVISELYTETENQRLQLRRLTQVQSELFNAKEMSEFLQAENELTREQLTESEGLLRSHLQGLRERNLQCEDLRVELQQLRVDKECLQQELVSTREKARLMLLDQGEQLAQATLDTSLLLQRVCALINDTHTTDHHNHKSSDGTVQTDPSPVPPPCRSFLNSVINALTEEQPCVTAPSTVPVSCVEEEDPIEGMGSRTSAFTRITPAELQNTNDVKHSTTLLELSSSLGESLSKLHLAIEQLKQHKDSEIHTLQKSIRDLQEEMEAQNTRHTAERAELKQQVGWLKGQVEKDTQALQQKTQDEKALRKLCSELEEKMEAAQKHRAENNELRREGSDLRRALQQSQVEVQALRAELQSSGQSAGSLNNLDDRIRLLREVEKLKSSLMGVEESRSKLLERAKRHQMVHAMNQSKLERELHLLDDMIEAVRKALASVPDVVNTCPELQKLVEYLG